MEDTRVGIIEKEQGILNKDGIYFSNPSIFAQEHLFFPSWGAEYLCGKPYCVLRTERDVFDSFILFYIVKGSMRFEYRGQSFSALPDDIILLDCKYPNRYWAESEVQFRWFHFRGNASQAYSDLLYERQQAHFPCHPALSIYFLNLLYRLQTDAENEHFLSVELHAILGGLADTVSAVQAVHPAVLSAQQYMNEHFMDSLSLADISSAIHLSPYHFSRLFHMGTGVSVHCYLVDIRIGHAKKLLSSTYDSVEQVAQQCGFSSTSHFIRAFKQIMHLTPSRFRALFR